MQPILYHTHHQSHTEDLPFWEKLAKDQGGPALELGCGTGRVLLALQCAGLAVYGLDVDFEMLAYLKRENPPAKVFQADLLHFHLGRLFHLIFLACNTWSSFTSSERLNALKGIRQHLAPGGIFAVSLPNPENLLELDECEGAEPEETFPHPQTGNPVQVSSEWEIEQLTENSRRVTFYWHYDHLFPDGHAERITHHARHWIEPAQTYLSEFEQSGLHPSAWGDFKRRPYKIVSSQYLIITGKKI